MKRRFALLAAYLLVTALMTAPFVNYRALDSASYEGDARLIIWTLAWDNHATLARIPLFDSNIFYPAAESLSYNEHLFGLSLFTLPIFAATANPVLAYTLVWLLSFVLNGLSMHALLRRHVRDDLAAFIGSLIYTFSFYKMLHAHGHLHLVWTWLLPLSLVALERWRDLPSWSRTVTWAVTLILQVLTSWYIAVIAAIVNAIWLLWHAPHLTDRWRTRALQVAAVAIVVAATTWPFARHYRYLAPASRQEAVSLSADLDAYLVPPENTRMGQWLIAHGSLAPRWIWGEQTLFIGWVALALAVCGLVVGSVRSQDRTTVALFATVTMVGFALSLGPFQVRPAKPDWSPYGFLTSLPGLGGLRAPARFALIVLLGISAMAAHFIARARTRVRETAMSAVLLAVSVLMLCEWYVVKFPAGQPQPFRIPPIYKLPSLKDARGVVSLPMYRGGTDWYRGADYLYFSMAHWRPIVNGYGRSEPPGYARTVSYMMAFPGPNNARALRELGVEYVIFHGGLYGPGATEYVRAAKDSHEYDLVAQIGSDYLFRVRAGQ